LSKFGLGDKPRQWASTLSGVSVSDLRSAEL
jgi:hypothetical protein